MLHKKALGLVLIVALVALTSMAWAEEQVTIKFASMKTFGVETMPGLIEKFEAANPNIKVEYIELPPPSMSTEIHQYLMTTLGSGASNVLDVFTGDCIWFPEFAEAGWLLELDEYFDSDYMKDYIKGTVETVTYKGKLVGMPWYMDGGFLYYRKDLLDKYGYEPPKTWTELKSMTKDILAKENNPELKGFIWQAKQAEVLVCDLVEFLGSEGKVLDDQGNIYINDENAKRAAQLMYDLIYTDKISPVAVNTYDEEPSRRVFTGGNAIFLRNWSYVHGIAQDVKESKVVDKTGIVPMPAFEGAKSASTLGGYQFAANAATEHPEAVAKFLEFMSSQETQKYFALTMSFAPTRIAVYDEPEVKENKPFIVQLKDVFVYSTPRPITPYYPQISLELQSEFSKLLTDKQDVAETVENLANAIKAIYE